MQSNTGIKTKAGVSFIRKDDIKMEFTKTGCEGVDCVQMILDGA